MMFPHDTWDMQSMRENNFLDEIIDLQMTLNYGKNTTKYFNFLFQIYKKKKSKF